MTESNMPLIGERFKLSINGLQNTKSAHGLPIIAKRRWPQELDHELQPRENFKISGPKSYHRGRELFTIPRDSWGYHSTELEKYRYADIWAAHRVSD